MNIMLLAEVMDKVEEGFALALTLAAITGPLGLIVGRWAPRPIVGVSFGLGVLLAVLIVLAELRSPFDDIRACALAEAGIRGVAQDVASAHLWWVAGLFGLLGGAWLRPSVKGLHESPVLHQGLTST